MSCLALWYSPRQGGTTGICTVEAHFNLWRLASKHRKVYQFLDVGLMLEEGTDISSLNMFVPFTVNGILDLGKNLERIDVVQAVFNESWCPVAYPDKSTIGIMDFDKKDIFQVHKLGPSEWSVTPQFNGSVITLLLPNKVSKKTYFRFRISAADLVGITEESKPSNSWLESAFFITETVDFHVNVERKLTDELLRTMHGEGQVKFSKTHLFLMRNYSYDHIFSYPPPSDTRMLEKNKWEEYLGSEYISDHVLAYHWKQKSLAEQQIPTTASNLTSKAELSFEDLTVFAKYRFQRVSKGTILLFISVLLGISVAASLFANWVFIMFLA
jgi:hypothetical protein